MQELVQFAEKCNYNLDTIVPDGNIHRFKVDSNKENGYYIFFQNYIQSSGQQYFVGLIGDWKSGEEYSYQSQTKMGKQDKELAKKQMKASQAEAERIKLETQEKASKECEEKWNSMQCTGTPSDYLISKGLREIFQSKTTRNSFDGTSSVVPLRDVSNRIWSLQTIQKNGSKLFHPGGRIKECFHQIGELKNEQPIRIVEGFATGASVFEATKEAVFVAFNANNLEPVARSLKAKYPDRSFILCGDDDTKTEGNPGRTKAESAAKSVLGVAVFPSLNDFDDVRRELGLEELKNQLKPKEEVKTFSHYSLGFKEKSHYFTSTHNEQIIEITSFSDTDFLNLMPLQYWESKFPTKQNGVNWILAKSTLMQECRDVGIFESKRIRGAGVWDDEGRTIVNMGDHLVVDGIVCNLNKIKSKYFYTLGIKLPGLHPNPLTKEECKVIVDACELFKWREKDFSFLLAGSMVVTRVCGALPIRPHLWITGEKGSGKTTLFNRLIYPLIGQPLLFLAGNSTEAGIRQELSANAIPVLFDEFENNGPKSAEIIQSVLDLLRVSWSETNAMVVKGSANGTAQFYQVRCSAIVTSIRQVSMSDADRSRFATIELAPHENDIEHWKELDSILNKIDMEFGNRLFARTIKLLPVLLQNFKTMKAALNRQKPGQRFGDQYGMLLAGYSLLLQDEPLSESDADEIASVIPLQEARDAAQITDQESALNKLSTKRFPLQETDGTRTETIYYTGAEAIQRARVNSFTRDALQTFGIRAEQDWFAIQVQNTELESLVFKGTAWSNNWGKSLARLQYAERKKVRIAGTVKECVILKYYLFE